MAKKNVTYVVSFEDKFSQGAKKAESNVSSFGKTVKRVGGALLAAFSARAIFKGLNNTIQLFDKQAQAVAQVEQGIASTGGTVGRTLEDLQKQASDFQSQTIFGDETILNDVTAQLLTFTNITERQFDRTQQAALDLSSRVGIDLKSATIQLGKALNDPIANLGALGRTGIQFSKDQKAVIKSLAESGRLAESQAIILDELEKQYGGSAKAARKAGLGGFKALKNTFGDLQEVIGKRLIKSSKGFAKGLDRMTKAAISLVEVPLSEELEKTRIQLNAELNVLKKGNLTVEQRKDLVNKINTEYKDYLPNLLSEKSTIEEIEAAQRGANDVLLERIALQAKQEILQKQINKVARARTKLFELQIAAEEERLELEKETNSESRIGKKLDQIAKKGLEDQIAVAMKLNEQRVKGAEEELQKLESQLDISADILKLQQQLSKGRGIPLTTEPSKELKAGFQTIKAAAPKTFNINIEKLTGVENLNTETVTEGAVETGNIVQLELQKALVDLQAR